MNKLLAVAALSVFSILTCLAQTHPPPAQIAGRAETRKMADGVEIIPIGKPQALRDPQGRFLDWKVQPREFVQSAAEGGDVDAMVLLGLQSGGEEGLKWLSKAANHGSISGMLYLSLFYRDGLRWAKNEKQADYWSDRAKSNLQAAWSGNDGHDLFEVAIRYLAGSVPPDMVGKITVTMGANSYVLDNTNYRVPECCELPFNPREGVKWLHRASEAGYYEARLHEYLLSTKGLVVKQEGQTPETIVEPNTDATVSEQWLKQVENSRDAVLAMTYANFYIKPSQDRLKLLRIAAEAGIQDAIYSVADSYATGADGITDADVAVTWLQRGVSAGSYQATTRLAEEYCRGKLVPKNQAAAESYYKEVSNSLLARFQVEQATPYADLALRYLGGGFYAELALRYASGVCVQRNEVTATALFAKIKDSVPTYGAVLLGLNKYNSPDVAPFLGGNPKYGLRLLEEFSSDAAPFGPGLKKSDIGSAQLLLAQIYTTGVGVPRDSSKAVSYLQKSARNDVPVAMVALGDSYARGNGVQKDNTQALNWYTEASKHGIPDAENKRAELEKQISQEQEISKQQSYSGATSTTASGSQQPSGPAAQSSPMSKPKALEHFKRGAQSYNAKDDVHAAEQFKAATEEDPGYSDAYYYLGMSLLGKTTLDASGRVQAYPGTALAFQTYLALEPNGKHSAEAQKMLGAVSAPLSSPEAVARASAIRSQHSTPTTVRSSKTNTNAHAPAAPANAVIGIHWSSTPIPQSVTIAFSFSERCLRDSCGDGAWGADIERDSQSAIDGSGNACEASTMRKGSCGTGNGGRYFVACKPGDPPKWAALAIYDDGSESLTDGEAIVYPTQSAAEQAAVLNCNHDGCHVVWSQPINCGREAQQAGHTYSGPYADWVQRLLSRVGAWSCPAAPPSVRAESCMRDGQVAAAVKYAWAAECYAEAGRNDDAQKSASSMMEMLKAAQSLCSNAPGIAGVPGCDTLSIFPCGSLQ